MASHSKKSRIFLHWLIPLSLLLLIAPFSSQIDLTLSSFFFNEESKNFSHNTFYQFVYQWGMLPAQVVGVLMLLLFILSYGISSLKKWRKSALFFILTLAIGAGAVTTVFKEEWKRPRPRQIVEYGGTEPFKPFYQPNFMAKGSFKSFPSGHCAMGFYFFALAILGKRLQNRFLFIGGLCLAFGMGITLSVTRIAQGGHFFTDTLAAACFMWITASTCDWLLYNKATTSEQTSQIG